jgi:hypothetical protein
MSRPVMIFVVPQGTEVKLNLPVGIVPSDDTPFAVTVDIDDTDEIILPYVSTLLAGIRTKIEDHGDSRIIKPGDVRGLKS